MRLLCLISVVTIGCMPKPVDPALREVSPAYFDADAGTPLLFVTEGLLPKTILDFDRPATSTRLQVVVSAFIDDGTNRIEVLDPEWVDSTRVTGRLAGPVPTGVYDVHLFEPRGRELVLLKALQALDCADGDCPVPDGGILDSGVVACDTLSFRDRDGDGFGSGTAQNFCGPGWVPLSGDCDDNNGLAFPGAIELCNGVDDDCDGEVDEGRCADAGWSADDSLRPMGEDLRSSASFAPGSLWVAAGDKVYVRRGGPAFLDASLGCSANVTRVVAETNGAAEVGGGDAGAGFVAQQLLGATQCSSERSVAAAPVAMIGFPAGADFDFVAVLEDGRLLRWRRGGVPVMSPSNLPASAQVKDLHGVSVNQLYAVGSAVFGNNRRQVVWALQGDGTWKVDNLPAQGTQSGTLMGVWALSAVDAIAVGEGGKVFRRGATGWRAIDTNSTRDFTSVRAFSTGRFYVTARDGTVSKYVNGLWQQVFRNDAGVAFNDLSATNEEDLWAVGDRGVVGRGPH